MNAIDVLAISLGDPQESVPELGCNGNLSNVEGGKRILAQRTVDCFFFFVKCDE